MLPTSSVSYSVESMVTSLYRSCREIDTLDKSQSDLLLKKAVNSVGKLLNDQKCHCEIPLPLDLSRFF